MGARIQTLASTAFSHLLSDWASKRVLLSIKAKTVLLLLVNHACAFSNPFN